MGGAHLTLDSDGGGGGGGGGLILLISEFAIIRKRPPMFT